MVAIRDCCISRINAVFDVYGQLTFERICEGKSYKPITLRIYKSKHDEELTKEKLNSSIFTGIRKALKITKCQMKWSAFRIIIFGAAVEVEIRKYEIKRSPIYFEIGNEYSPNWTFAKLTIVDWISYGSSVKVEAFNYRFVAIIHLLNSIMNGTGINDITHGGTIGYIIETVHLQK